MKSVLKNELEILKDLEKLYNKSKKALLNSDDLRLDYEYLASVIDNANDDELELIRQRLLSLELNFLRQIQLLEKGIK